jgi:hypothetical protein
MKGILLSRRGDDGVHLTAERELHRGLDRVTGEPSRADGAAAVVRLFAAAQPPGPHRHPPRSPDLPDLVVRADQGDLAAERLLQGASGDLRADAAGIAQRDSNAGRRIPRRPASAPALLRAPQIRIST